MKSLSRREVLRAAAAVPLLPAAAACRTPEAPAVIASRPTDIRIVEVAFDFEEFRYRTPYRFGGRSVDRTTLLNVRCTVRDAGGRTAAGAGSMTLGNAWSFPSKVLPFDATMEAMRRLAERIAAVTRGCPETGHPLDLGRALEPAWLAAAAELSRGLPEPIPKLCVLVTASPFDAALHDAYGKLHGRSCWKTYGPDFVARDLSMDLGPDFRGGFADRYVLGTPVSRMPVYHSVGASDPITAADVKAPVGDGLPETLPEWIRRDGITHVKIKMDGADMKGDLERVLKIDRATAETQAERGVASWKYLLDFNEKCAGAEALLEFLRRLREAAPAAFERVQYIEQPTSRYLKQDRGNAMNAVSKLRPVVIDEALTDLESLLLAREMGYTGVALKACKGQTQTVLMAAAAQKYGMFLCVQDLTCPGASLLHSVSIAAHVPGVSGIEANARQYVPAANAPWAERYPGVFRFKDGQMDTSGLAGDGLY